MDLLEILWKTAISESFGGVIPNKVFGISKGNIAAMRLRESPLRRTTSIAEPLDALLERHRRENNIDCFVVAWDLVPPWDKEASICRWNEVLAFYEGLAISTSLDQQFKDCARQRFQEMDARDRPNARLAPPILERGSIIAACADPIFESIFMNERAMRKCLGVSGVRVKGWPSGWHKDNRNAPHVVEAAVAAARKVSSAKVFKQIGQDYETLKTEWGIHFFQSSQFARHIVNHPFARRFREIRAA